MGIAAILVMWPGPFEQTFVPPSQGGSIWNLASIDPVVSEKMFENVDTHTHTHPRTTEAYLYYKFTNEPKGSGVLIIKPQFIMASIINRQNMVNRHKKKICGKISQIWHIFMAFLRWINLDKNLEIMCSSMSHITRKPVFGVCDQVRLQLACSATEAK